MADYRRKKHVKVNTGRKVRRMAARQAQSPTSVERSSGNPAPAVPEEQGFTPLEPMPAPMPEQSPEKKQSPEERLPSKTKQRKPPRHLKHPFGRTTPSPKPEKAPRKRFRGQESASPVKPVISENDRPVFSLLEGRKALRQHQKLAALAAVAVVLAAVVLVSACTPVGLLEWIQNQSAMLGSGAGYPVESVGEVFTSVQTNGKVVSALSQSCVSFYNQQGKTVTYTSLAYDTPALVQSVSRYVLFDRGGTGYQIGNLSGTLFTGNLENGILAAAVGRSGVVAFATASASYDGELLVYNKHQKNMYHWYSADGTLTAAAVSDNGRKVATAAVKVENGQYLSTVTLFQLSKSEPVATLPLSGSLVVSMERLTANTFLVLCTDQALVVNWAGTILGTYSASGALALVDHTESTVALVDASSSNAGLYTVCLLSDGQVSHTFQVHHSVKDIALSDHYLFLLGDDAVTAYTYDGVPVEQYVCDYSVTDLVGYTGGRVLAVSAGELALMGPVSKEAAKASAG